MSYQPCLPVPRRRKRDGDADAQASFDNVESMDAMEYMAAVVQQANALPEFFVASTSPDAPSNNNHHVPIEGSAASLQYLLSHRTAVLPPPTPDHAPSDASWADATLANFSTLRIYIERLTRTGERKVLLPPMKDRAGWHIFCVGQDEARGGTYFEDDEEEEEDEAVVVEPWRTLVPPHGYEPTVSLLLQMDQVMIRRVLSHLLFFMDSHGISPQRTAWLYALLATLERPIHREEASTLYGMLKVLTILRNKMDASRHRDQLARINVLVCIVGLYFEQSGGYDSIFKC